MPALISPESIRFLDFEFFPRQRRLDRKGAPVPLSSRALDILRVLTERPGEVVSKRDLLAEVWPHAVVDEGSIRFHMVALRRALGDGDGISSCIVTVPGRGYCFVGAGSDAPHRGAPGNALPMRLAGPGWIVGRDLDVAEVLRRLDAQRCVTVVGAGGVGKSAVAALAAERWRASYGGGVAVVDLGEVEHDAADAVAAALAAELGLGPADSPPLAASLGALIRHPRLLLLETCEAAIEGTAEVVAAILRAAPQCFVLTTSREPLRVEGESLYRLKPLTVPPAAIGVTMGEAMAFPAVNLFVECATRLGHFELTDANAPLVARICRRLDGLPLALEMAAGRVAAFGLHGVEAQLATGFTLNWPGSRTACARQRTLQADLDWSYERLLDEEREALARLSTLAEPFSLEAALTAGMEPTSMMQAIAGLTAKSLLAIDEASPGCYRMLEITRMFAREKAARCAEDGRLRQVRPSSGARRESRTSPSPAIERSCPNLAA
jgi:predicted ATPase/DNA-binding winged helix-turn-helix (wHTH) protein